MSTDLLAQILDQAADRSRVARGANIRDWLIYGAGRTGRQWAVFLAADGRQVHGFIDRRAPASGGGAIPVFRPDECPADLRDRCGLLLALHNPGVDVGMVRAGLQEEGYRNIWLLQDLIDAWPQGSNFWLAPSAETLPFTDGIHAAYGALADERSRELFAALLNQRLNGVLDLLSAGSVDEHYLPADLPPPLTPVRFIDCGAYTGDTIESFLRQGLDFEEIAAFEPDPAHYPTLCAGLSARRATVFPCGVWDHMTQLRFVSDDSASHIAAEGSITVQTLSLDQALPNFAPNYIKMDIEGAESKALAGAQGLISRYRPRLAISTYHKPRDLWELQLQVQGWNLGYQFYLRSHASSGFETVLYALPT